MSESGEQLSLSYKMFVREIEETHEYDNQWDHVWSDFVNERLVVHEKLNGANLFALRIKPAHDRFLQQLMTDPLYCAVKRFK